MENNYFTTTATVEDFNNFINVKTSIVLLYLVVINH